MAKKIQLSIAEPCHENWDGMTPVEKGKFCGSCQKQVIDFTDMSDRLVAEFFKKPSTGSVCGRFMTDQLERDIAIPRKRIPWVKYFFQFTLPAFLLTLKGSASVTQGKPRIVNTDTSKKSVNDSYRTLGMVARFDEREIILKDTIVKPIEKPITKIDKQEIVVDTPIYVIAGMIAVERVTPATEKGKIIGRVINEEGDAVSFASISMPGSKEIIVADENGYFQIKKKWSSSAGYFTVTSTGFEEFKQIKGEEKFEANVLTITLQSTETLPEIIVTTMGYTKGKVISGSVKKTTCTTNASDTEATEKKEHVAPFTFKIFPNPIQPGRSISIEVNKLDEGYYELLLSNQSGQLVKEQSIWIDAAARILDFEIPVISKGVYVLQLLNKKTGKSYREQLVVQ